MKILTVVGTRPNFVKAAALWQAFRPYEEVNFSLVHTGQHYDAALDNIFFQQLEIPEPAHCLGVGSDTPNRQLAQMLLGLEPVFEKEKPELVIVVGDTTSTLAGALAANRMNILLAHVEAGLRSGDRAMPEEINRILTDHLSDYLFVTEQVGLDNLESSILSKFSKLGKYDAHQKVFFTGNCMIDTLVRFREKSAETATVQKLGLKAKNYVLVTLHRPSNVDARNADSLSALRGNGLEAVVQMLEAVCRDTPTVFPLHPRTRISLEKLGLKTRLEALQNLQLLEPQGYFEFLNLLENAALAITDSGGVQDETTFLGVPCLTLRTTTERPVTVEMGTNELMPAFDPAIVRAKIRQAIEGQWKTGSMPPLWDGQSARRIAEILVNLSARTE